MATTRTYRVRWILLLRDQPKGGLCGMTTHEGATPAAAALAGADAVFHAVRRDCQPQELQVLGVFGEDDPRNLLSDQDLQAAVRYHHRPLPCAVTFRPLC
ncbi:MAG: hypothetical protein IRY94_13065 [Rhodospirillaceae bacterium]|nr:hypothetical protein [Rhodospirillaceae bacterium]